MLHSPNAALIYTRISDARAEADDEPAAEPSHPRRRMVTTTGVDDQVKRCRELAKRLGWQVGPDATHVLIENDTSAFTRRVVTLPDGSRGTRVIRPRFRAGLAMLASGEADGLIALDLDRAVRDPRDLEDLIDVVEGGNPRVPVESVTGSLRLSNDADITMARVQVAIANKSSRDTARRVRDARQRNAAAGRYNGGIRPFGYERDGKTVRPARRTRW